MLVTAGFDLLRDEGENFGRRLHATGVPVAHLHAADLPHGFAGMDGEIRAADRALTRMTAMLRTALLA